jgi:hypothetical protein
MQASRHTVCALVVLAAGCGGARHAAARHAAAARSGCTRAVAAAVAAAAHAGAVRATPTAPEAGVLGCRYARAADGRPLATLTLDANPQGFYRFQRAVEERDQVALWTHMPREAPRTVPRIGIGADWVPGDAVLLATDDRRLLTVLTRGAPHAQAVAVAAARAVLPSRARAG